MEKKLQTKPGAYDVIRTMDSRAAFDSRGSIRTPFTFKSTSLGQIFVSIVEGSRTLHEEPRRTQKSCCEVDTMTLSTIALCRSVFCVIRFRDVFPLILIF